MTTIICEDCYEPKVVTSRNVTLPFVCDECQNDAELLAAMAPATTCDNSKCGCHSLVPGEWACAESPAAQPCDSASIENTTLLIEDQANQLALAKNEVEGLRAIVSFLEAREIALMDQVEAKQNQVENLLVKNFFKDEKIVVLVKRAETLGVAGFQQAVRTLELWAEGADLARRYDALKTAEVDKLTHEHDVWMKRAMFAKRAYDRASADRRYYRGKLKDAGIKAATN